MREPAAALTVWPPKPFKSNLSREPFGTGWGCHGDVCSQIWC